MTVNHPRWFSGTVDRLILALAIASPLDGPEGFDSEYSESMVVVFDMWLDYKSRPKRTGSGHSAVLTGF